MNILNSGDINPGSGSSPSAGGAILTENGVDAKISAMTAATTLSPADILTMLQGGANKKFAASLIGKIWDNASYVNSSITGQNSIQAAIDVAETKSVRQSIVIATGEYTEDLSISSTSTTDISLHFADSVIINGDLVIENPNTIIKGFPLITGDLKIKTPTAEFSDASQLEVMVAGDLYLASDERYGDVDDGYIAGDTQIDVTRVDEIVAGQTQITILLDNGEYFSTYITNLLDNRITINDALPSAVSQFQPYQIYNPNSVAIKTIFSGLVLLNNDTKKIFLHDLDVDGNPVDNYAGQASFNDFSLIGARLISGLPLSTREVFFNNGCLGVPNIFKNTNLDLNQWSNPEGLTEFEIGWILRGNNDGYIYKSKITGNTARPALTTLTLTSGGGNTALFVDSYANFNVDTVVGKKISVKLNTGAWHNTTISSLSSPNRINIANALPSQASIGNIVYTTDWDYGFDFYSKNQLGRSVNAFGTIQINQDKYTNGAVVGGINATTENVNADSIYTGNYNELGNIPSGTDYSLTIGNGLQYDSGSSFNGSAARELSIASSILCDAYDNTGTTLAVLDFTKINFNTTTINQGSGYDTTNKYFKPDVAGYYKIFCQLKVGDIVSGSEYALGALKNGTLYKILDDVEIDAQTFVCLKGSCIVYLNGTTDYVEITAFNGNGSTAAATSNQSNDNYFDANFISF